MSELAAKIRAKEENHSDLIRTILGKVIVLKASVEIRLSEIGLSQALGISLNITVQEASATVAEGAVQNTAPALNIDVKNQALVIVTNSHLLRCGRQVKLILGTIQMKLPNPIPGWWRYSPRPDIGLMD